MQGAALVLRKRSSRSFAGGSSAALSEKYDNKDITIILVFI